MCAPLRYQGTTNNPITPGTAAHQQEIANPEKHYNLGMLDENTTLRYFDGMIQLGYYDGKYCNRAARLRQTLITFICDESEGEGYPLFEFEQSCTYAFSWRTSYACRTKKISAGAIFAIV